MRILITGSRDWTDVGIIESAICAVVLGADIGAREHLPRDTVTIVHGAARGADTIAGQVAARRGWRVEAHPADWERLGRRAGAERNWEMAQAGADVCLAFPLRESRGTRMMMSMAHELAIPVISFERSGR